MAKLVFGVGVNDANYTVQIRETVCGTGNKRKRVLVWVCPYYARWAGVLQRCLCEKFKKKLPCYEDVRVCEEWLTFSNFKAWMETQDWEGKYLDKDILSSGSRIYSPDTCAFVTPRVNSIVADSRRDGERSRLLLGVGRAKKKFTARVTNFEGERQFLGVFDSPEEAHRAWQKHKVGVLMDVASTCDDNRIAERLMEAADRIKYDYDNWQITNKIWRC